ncbi:MAG: hemolysin III family protein [Planctomycetes bacterium]|nr:hemolysin III family protein [Planctomycetota bacterium]
MNDPVSTATHLLGAIAVAAFTPTLIRGTRGGARLSLLVFSLSAVLLLSCSAAFHGLPAGAARQVLQRLDHAAIFVLIAGTFTPVHTILFKGVARWGMLWLIWSVAVAGIALKLVYFETCPQWLGVGVYVAMGWLGLYAMVALSLRIGVRFIAPLLIGGLFYTAGAVIELVGWPVIWPGVIRPHELFHVAVLAGLWGHWRFVLRAARVSTSENSATGAA